jgi:hypothetical protein
MPDNTMPSRAANMEKAEGDRSTAEENIRQAERSSGAPRRDSGRRRTKLADPTAERSSDPIPDGERVVENSVDDDVVARENPGRGETPRRYDEELEQGDTVMPSNDSTLKTRI